MASMMVLFAITPMVHAEVNPVDSVNKGVTAAGGKNNNGADLKGSIRTIVDILLFVLGAIAVIVIVVGGLRYVLSAGDSNSITAAKNTILYAVIGLIVALLAYAIVNWVIAQFA